MKLNDFMSAVLSESGAEARPMYRITQIKKNANLIYKANCVPPDFTTVRFDSSIMRTEQSRTTHFNLLVKLTPEHPYFRPWLKLSTIRCTEPLYVCKLENGAPKLSLCEHSGDAELRSIIDTIEKRIINRITQFEQYVRSLDRIADHYDLQFEDISDFLKATDYLVEYANYDQKFFLSAENRATLLPD